MAKRIAVITTSGATVEAIPFDGSYPGDAITITEDTSNDMDDFSMYEKSDVADDFDERGICQIYKDGVLHRYLIFDADSFYQFNAQGGYNVYIWKKAQLSDTESEQTLTTGSGELTLTKLDSGQAALPTFSGDVLVAIGNTYQDRGAYISTVPSISSGNVQFGLTLGSGVEGTPYVDIIVIQLT